MIIELIGGILLTDIFPVIFISQFVVPANKKRQLQMEAVFSKNLAENLSLLTLLTVFVLSILFQNSDILIGTLFGSCLFQVLAVNGIDRINSSGGQEFVFFLENIFKGNQDANQKFPENEPKIRYRSSGQFLVFSVILLLFLSADYLLPKGTSQNILSRVDGVLLIGAFILYWHLMWGKKGEEKPVDEKININAAYIGKGIICLFILEIFIVTGSILLIRSSSEIGVEFEVPQYSMGLTLLTWCANLSGILLKQMAMKRDTMEERDMIEYVQYSMERSMGRAVFCLTVLLGAVVVIKPIIIQASQIYDLMGFAVIALLVQIFRKADSRLVGSGMAAVYIGFMIHVLVR